MDYLDYKLVKAYLKTDFEPWVLSEGYIENLIQMNHLMRDDIKDDLK